MATAPLKQPGKLERRLVGFFVRRTLFRRRHGKTWPVPAELPCNAFRFEGNTGADIAARHFPIPGAKGIVVLAHPDRRYGQHWFVKTGWIAWLREHKCSALTFDFSNYGDSRGGSTYLFEDVVAAVREARRLEPKLPVHVVGVSIGAFSVANASPWFGPVASITLESPYPSFDSWYEGDGHRFGKAVMRAFNRMWPKTARLIQADERISHADTGRVLVVASASDKVTALALSKRVADGVAPGKLTWLELDGIEHLDLFEESEAYREAVLANFTR